MQALLVVMACAFTPPEVHSCPDSVAAELAPKLETGTLLFSDGKCLAVKLFSWSQYTHVATVVRGEEGVYVYDSINEIGVRRLTLAAYLAATKGEEIEVLIPGQSFSEARSRRYDAYLESQLGRPYAIMHYVTGGRCEGLHCAEYITDALMDANLITAEQPSRVSPKNLRAALLMYDIYEPAATFVIEKPDPEPPPEANWCEELWFETKTCCSSCWDGFSGCVLCQ